MIRKLRRGDLDRTAEIWLVANLQAHDFIAPEYWKDNQEPVKKLLPQAEVYVYESGGEILGFVGLDGEYIEGIFVAGKAQSNGIGKSLLDFLKAERPELHLNAYQKNTRAIRFYEREGFRIQSEGLDEATGEKDYAMVWQRELDYAELSKARDEAKQLQIYKANAEMLLRTDAEEQRQTRERQQEK